SPDAPVGVGAVAKLCEVGKSPTMKLSRGSGKATLPGRVQVFRGEGGDTVALKGEYPPGRPLLERVWEHRSPCLSADPGAARERAQRELAALPAEWKRPRQATLQLSPRLYALVAELAGAK
ncbi:MAG TPA: nicotinate phosphoribosyltransferase, partial [Myxococcota bacterium]|nr:nicotinate phosphoribosyltransferase [Myxococcota bacterium]